MSYIMQLKHDQGHYCGVLPKNYVNGHQFLLFPVWAKQFWACSDNESVFWSDLAMMQKTQQTRLIRLISRLM